ncbi:MAG TPA: hypothetical protein VGF14_00095 [Alphaproteobacteria bacterium]
MSGYNYNLTFTNSGQKGDVKGYHVTPTDHIFQKPNEDKKDPPKDPDDTDPKDTSGRGGLELSPQQEELVNFKKEAENSTTNKYIDPQTGQEVTFEEYQRSQRLIEKMQEIEQIMNKRHKNQSHDFDMSH